MVKAKEYYDMYRENLLSPHQEVAATAVHSIIVSLLEEAMDIVKSRNISKASSLQSVIKELNQKYNAICNLFEKNDGYSPLRRNAFIEYVNSQLPDYLRK